MHAAAHGLEWLAANLAERAPAVLVVDDVHWADAPSLRWLAQLAARLEELRLGVLCAVRSGEPAGAAGPARGAARRRAGGPAAAARARPGRGGGAGPRAASRRRTRASRMPATPSPPATRSCSARCSVTSRPSASRPTDQVAAGLSAFGPEQVARSVRAPARAAARRRRGPRARARRARPRRAAAARRATSPASTPEDAATAGRRAAGRGAARGRAASSRSPIRSSPVRCARASVPASSRSGTPGRRAMLAAEGADPERVALHLLRTDPAADPETVAVLRAAAERALARGAPESAATFLRRALAEPPLDAGDRRRRPPRARARARRARPARRRPACCTRPSSSRRRPASASTIALRGARALGLAGHFDEARRSSAAAGSSTPPTSRPKPSRGSRRSSSATPRCTPRRARGARATAQPGRPGADARALASQRGHARPCSTGNRPARRSSCSAPALNERRARQRAGFAAEHASRRSCSSRRRARDGAARAARR